MTDRAKDARRAYLRAWRASNKDKVREYNRRYWERRVLREGEKVGEAETGNLQRRN